MSEITLSLTAKEAIAKASELDAKAHLVSLENKERDRVIKANEAKMKACLIAFSLLVSTPLLYCSFTLVKSLL